MNVPNFLNIQIVDPKTGYFTDSARQIFQQLFGEAQTNLSNEGLIVPSQNTTNIGILNNIKSKNALLVNSDTNALLFNQNGTFKTVTVT